MAAPEPTPVPTAAAVPQSPPHPATGKMRILEARPKTAAPQPAAETAGWFARLRKGLAKSSRALSDNIAAVVAKRRLDDETLQDLEDVLIRADLGIETAMRITEALSAQRYGRDISENEVRAVMASEIAKVLEPVAIPLELDLEHRPHVILVVGVNGTGKTTTIGKLAAKLRDCRTFDPDGRRRHLPRRRNRAAEDLGRAHRFAQSPPARSAPMPRVSLMMPTARRLPKATT